MRLARFKIRLSRFHHLPLGKLFPNANSFA